MLSGPWKYLPNVEHILRAERDRMPIDEQYQAPPSYSPPPSMPVAPASAPSYPPQQSYPSSFEQPKVEPIDLSRLLASASASVPSTSTAPPVPDIANLFSALVKAGVVPASTGPGAVKIEEASTPADPAREAARAYRQFVLSHKVKLTSSDITRYVYHNWFAWDTF